MADDAPPRASPGRAAFVGVFSAAVVLVTGISPNGLWGVAQYAIAGVLLDAALTIRPSIGSRAVYMALLGATVLLAVGWIAPLGRSMTGGIPMTEIWPSVVSFAGAGLSRLFVLDIVFGATAGLMSFGLARALMPSRRPAGNAPELPHHGLRSRMRRAARRGQRIRPDVPRIDDGDVRCCSVLLLLSDCE